MQIKHNTNVGYYTIDFEEKNNLVNAVNNIILPDSRNILKLCTNKTYYNMLPFVERIDWLTSDHYNLCVIKAIEEKQKINVKENVLAIRTLILEIQRLSCNLNSLRNLFILTRDNVLKNICTDIIETLFSYYETICGHRIFHNFHTLGGFNQNFTVGNFEKTISLIKNISFKTLYLIDIASNIPSIKTNLSELACVQEFENDLRMTGEYFYYSDDKIKNILINKFDMKKQCAYYRFLKTIDDLKKSLEILNYLKSLNLAFNTNELKDHNTISNTTYNSLIASPRGILNISFSTNKNNLISQILIKDPSSVAINRLKNSLEKTLTDDIKLVVNSFFISFLEIVK